MKVLRRLLVPGVALAAAAGPVAGQDAAIEGVVRDTAGRALAHAVVLVSPGSREVVTGVDGRFAVRRLAAGEYRLDVSLPGYAPVVQRVEVGAGVAEVEVALRPSPLSLPGVQVTASVAARPPSAVLQSTTQLSGRALERELAGSVAQTLARQPGIAVRFNGPGAAMPVVRGLTGDRVLMLQDGQRTGDLAGSADDHGVTVDALAVQRVEVVRGPATLLYGNNALGGVVNVISGDLAGGIAHRAQAAFAAQAESAYPGSAAQARLAVPLSSGLGIVARGGYRTADDMRLGAGGDGRGRLPNTHVRNVHGAVTLAHVLPNWSGALSVRAHDFEHGVPAPPDAELITLAGGRLEVAGRGEFGLASAVAPVFPTARVDFTAQSYAHDELNTGGGVEQRFRLDTRTLNVLVHQAPLARLAEGAWGVSLLHKDYAATGEAALTPPADSRAAGIFVFQELLTGIGGSSLQVGARGDAYRIVSHAAPKFGDGVERTFTALSGSAGVRVPLGAGSLAFTAARSFRAPTVEELFSGAAHAGTGAVEFGDPLLAAERGVSFEALGHVQSGRVSGQLAVHRNRIDNYIMLVFQRDTVLGGATLPVFRYAQAPATLYGAEASVEVAVGSRTAAEFRGDWLRAHQADGTPLSFMPAPRVGAGLRWDDGRWSAGADAEHAFAQRRVGVAGEVPTAAYTLLRVDAGALFRTGGQLHSIGIRVDNLLDVEYRDASSRIRDFAPAAGRNISVIYRGWFMP